MLRMALLQGTLDPNSDDTVEKLMQQFLCQNPPSLMTSIFTALLLAAAERKKTQIVLKGHL